MKIMLTLGVYMVCSERNGCNTVSDRSFILSIFLGFLHLSLSVFFGFLHLSLFLFLGMSTSTRLPTRKRFLAPKLQDANNAAEPEIRMHQRDPRPQSVPSGDRDSPPHSRNDAAETSSNVRDPQESGTETVLGALVIS